MIRPIREGELEECVRVIRDSFSTVAEAFGLSPENAPRFTAFATTLERLAGQYREGRAMFVHVEEDGKVTGYYSLRIQEEGDCELNNLCVLPGRRHAGIGKRLLEHGLLCASAFGCGRLKLGIVEENTVLRAWYERFGFLHTHMEKYDFFPFTCGYMERPLEFCFFDTEFLTDGEILLMLDKTVPGSPAEKWLPSYHFTICDRAGHRAGQCDLRIGYSEGVYYGGNIGYRVEEPYRGNHYAGKACRLLFHLARRHGMDYLVITCNPDNYPSRKTCEYAGGILREIADLPEDNDMRRDGETRKCIYEFAI